MTPGTPLSRIAALALLLFVVGLPLWIAAAALGEGWQAAVADLRRQDAALAVRQAEAEAARAAGAATGLQGLILPAGPASAGTAALQRRLQGVVADAGGEVESVEPLPSDSAEGFRRITLRVQLRLDTPGLRAILHALEYGEPSVLVDNLTVRALTGRAVGAERPLSVRFDMTALQPERA